MILEKMKGNTEDEWLLSYYDSVKKGLAEGRRYTERLIFNKPEYLNDTGRIYTKPVILLADPSCYSYCDYFSTSMQDHQAAEIWIENGQHTGGGGASVTSYESFAQLLPEMMPALPQDQKMGIAFSSGYRTGAKAGVSIENLGADADHVYHTTFNDLKKDDEDLVQALDQRLQELK
jgi:C-terminal processing protease CtpA/Prc